MHVCGKLHARALIRELLSAPASALTANHTTPHSDTDLCSIQRRMPQKGGTMLACVASSIQCGLAALHPSMHADDKQLTIPCMHADNKHACIALNPVLGLGLGVLGLGLGVGFWV